MGWLGWVGIAAGYWCCSLPLWWWVWRENEYACPTPEDLATAFFWGWLWPFICLCGVIWKVTDVIDNSEWWTRPICKRKGE